MSSTIALLVCALGIAGLFFLDRDKSIRTSKALWLPITWLAIVGSRPVSVWLGISAASATSDPNMDGSPMDRLIYEILLGIGLVVLFRRRRQVGIFLRGNWPILLYFFYCLLSVVWSDYPDISFKRWVKAIGDLAMVLIVITDARPAEAFTRLISRVGFVLLPASILLIKYYGDLGRGYDPSGMPMNTGVTTNKNTLGVIALALALGGLWNFLGVRRAKDRPDRRRHLIAQGTLLAFGIAVLLMAHSATSLACFGLGAALMVATGLTAVRSRPARVHALIFGLFLAGGLSTFIGGGAGVIHALGRDTNFTGRTEIWQAVISAVVNPVLGAGFESFWLGPRLYQVWSRLSEYMHVNEAHNGYLEVYLNLGWIGVGLIALILTKAYKDIVASFRHDFVVGGLLLAYLFAATFYSVTEAGFRLLNPMWIFLLFAVAAAGGAQGAGALQPSEEAFSIHNSPVRWPQRAELSGQRAAPYPFRSREEGVRRIG